MTTTDNNSTNGPTGDGWMFGDFTGHPITEPGVPFDNPFLTGFGIGDRRFGPHGSRFDAIGDPFGPSSELLELIAMGLALSLLSDPIMGDDSFLSEPHTVLVYNGKVIGIVPPGTTIDDLLAGKTTDGAPDAAATNDASDRCALGHDGYTCTDDTCGLKAFLSTMRNS